MPSKEKLKSSKTTKSKSKSETTKKPSSFIKGGGRASLSSEAEERIISLLYDLRDSHNPLLPKEPYGDEEICFDELSKHAKKTVKKKFVKKLVEFHTRLILNQKLNSNVTAQDDNGNDDDERDSEEYKERTESVGTNDRKFSTTGTANPQSLGNVRFCAVEALYGKKSKSKDVDEKVQRSKDSKSDKKSGDKKSGEKKKKSKEQQPLWKEGSTRKTLVLPRSTTVKELMITLKAKLRMKKNPTRCFYVQKKFEIDLKGDLSGLDDGSVVFVTSHAGEIDEKEVGGSATSSNEKSNGSSLFDGVEVNGNEYDLATMEQVIVDPLESVKKAYRLRKNAIIQKKSRTCLGDDLSSSSHAMTLQQQELRERIFFTKHIENLPSLPDQRKSLPASAYRSTILSTLDTSRVMIICGETGCGKSTQVPQYILEGLLTSESACRDNGNSRSTETSQILVTQPRRVAATSLAMRVAKERGTGMPGKIGSEVGYNVRLNRAVADSARIVYCTVGILLRMLVNPMEDVSVHESDDDNPVVPLSNVSHVIIDEVHERDLNTDFALTLLRPLLTVNNRLSVILMSATASAQLFVDYFSKLGSDVSTDSMRCVDDLKPKVISIPGRTFPVQMKWLRSCEEIASDRLLGWTNEVAEKEDRNNNKYESEEIVLSPRASSRIDNAFIVKLIKSIISSQKSQQQREHKESSSSISSSKIPEKRKDGAVLVFLPGKGEIEALSRALYKDPAFQNKSTCRILHLYSSLPPSEQSYVFQSVPLNTNKIILATNVAETSITIPDVSHVIDTGRVKESRFNPSTRIKELVTVWISRASAKQRAGRAGRTGPGVCYRLYTEEFTESVMEERTSPEIVRTPLDELVLQVCLLEEQKRGLPDSPTSLTSKVSSLQSSFLVGTSPIKFLAEAPEPPPTKNLLHACKHLMDVGAITIVSREPDLSFRLTPLGYHLSHLPMDAKVGKLLIVGCMLECIDPALTIAASLSCTKSCWLSHVADGKVKDAQTQSARELQNRIVEDGFGGLNWHGGTVKGDLMGVVAAYDAWVNSHKSNLDRRKFARENALDHYALMEMKGLRTQFRDSLVDAGFLTGNKNSMEQKCNNDDAYLTSCCLVAGLYPNIATLLRPSREKRIRGGRLITKDGDSCRPSSSSFQNERVRNAKETGKDVYAVYHGKHRNVGVAKVGKEGSNDNNDRTNKECFLSELNFISRFSLILFGGGEIEVRDNFLVVDGWLKFKVGDKSKDNSILIQELRKELDNVMLKHIMEAGANDNDSLEMECRRVLDVVKLLLSEE